MREFDNSRTVRLVFEVKVRLPEGNRGLGLGEVLEILSRSGDCVRAQDLYSPPMERFAYFICDNPTETAAALCDAGYEASTGTAVTILLEDGPSVLRPLILSLEAAGLTIDRCYSVSSSREFFAVFRTNDNPRAEDVLINYLHLEDRGVAVAP